MADDRFRGMTMIERLFEAGLIDEWDKAVNVKDASKMADILVRVSISPDEATQTATTILANSKLYGY